MAGLLLPDDVTQPLQPLLPVGDDRPPALQPDDRADAMAQLYRRLADRTEKNVQHGIWSPDNAVGTETLQSMSMPKPTLQAGLLGQYIDPSTGQMTDQGRERMNNPALGFDTGGIGGMAKVTPGFTAYHGSPHDFPPTARNPLGEFDPAKIGTGEGAQAYGVGAGYLAGHEPVAKGYRDALVQGQGGHNDIKTILQRFSGWGTPAEADVREALTGSASLTALADNPSVINAVRRLAPDYNPSGPVSEDALRHYRTIDSAIEAARPKGHMYEVKVNADPEHFLDWNKPLEEQSKHVQDALTPERLGLRAVGPFGPKGYHGWADSDGKRVGMGLQSGEPPPIVLPMERGSEIYRQLHDDPAKAAALLQKAGIPGIRYLDAGSRGAGEGSHNFVVFSPEIMEIIRKYGLLGMLGGGAAAGLGGTANAAPAGVLGQPSE